MEPTPTRGASERDLQGWGRSPVAAFAVRVLARGLPVLAAWVSIQLVSSTLIRPAGWFGIAIWLVQALVVAVAASMLMDRFSRRLLPLAVLFNLSLVFPDQAPSRFGIALRAGSPKRLQARVDEIAANGLTGDASQAAEQALELVAALGSHDRRTRGHTERVRAYADLIADELGLPEADRLRLAWGVLLHDVGKLTVPGEILNKETPLTHDEWMVLRGHPEAGRRLLAPLEEWLGPWILAASEHHERWDGDGYPLGLAGTEISLSGRITAVADAYDVITSKRSYKEAMSAEAARQEMVRCAGSQFDPVVVRALLTASVGRRWTGGAFASFAELPSLGQVGSSLGGAAVTAAAAGAATAAAVTGAVPLVETVSTVAAAEEPSPTTESPVAAVTTTSPDAPIVLRSSSDRRSTDASSIDEVDDSPVPDPAPLTAGSPTDDGGAPTTTTTATAPAPSTTSTTTTPASSSGPPSTTTTSTPGSSPSTTTTSAPGSSPSTTTTPPTTTTAPGSSPSTTSTSTPTSTTTTTTPPTTTTTTPASGDLHVFLTNPGTGNTRSSAELPLDDGPHDEGSLPNYDTDRDSVPGLKIAKDGAGLSTTDATKRQDWMWTASGTTSLNGNATLRVYVGTADLEDDEEIGIEAGLYVCSPSCTQITSGTWSSTSRSGRYRLATIDFGVIDETLSSGDRLRLRIVAPDSINDADVSLAYDAGGYPARLKVG